MSYSCQLPGSAIIDKNKLKETEIPSAGGTVQRSCYSFIEKISSLANPVSLQHDVMYANAFAAVLERDELSENETPVAIGCVGHRPDREFPLESKTTVPLPLIMYPTETCGNTLDKADMCAMPVLNWKEYIQEIKNSQKMKLQNNTNSQPGQDEVTEPMRSIPEEPLQQSSDSESTPAAIEWTSEPNANVCQTQLNTKRAKTVSELDNLNQPSSSIDTFNKKATRLVEGQRKITHTYPLRKMRNVAVSDGKDDFEKNILKQRFFEKICAKTQRRSKLAPVRQSTSQQPAQPTANATTKNDKLTLSSLIKLKYQPKLRIEGTWNYLYGGYNGACCFMKVKGSKNLRLFLGKGSLLRAVELKEAIPSSIFSYTVDSIWDQDPDPSSGSSSHPFDELIFQLVPNTANQLLGLRRGRSIQIYNTDGEIPDLLESIPNTFYGTSEYYHNDRIQKPKKITFCQDPLLRGFDFNPTFGPEIISIDENQVIRVCNIYRRAISEQFVLPSSVYIPSPKDYPDFKINDAVGITFANNNHLFYAWGNSVVHLGDRRCKKYSRSHIAPLFDLRNHVHSVALSSQNYFHETKPKLNEYMSCVRRSKRDPYYFVGTTMKIYLMDLRVPFHPVISVSHGLQSPLTYMDTCLDKEENFETIVAGSQMSSETVCMFTDFAHLECTKRPGCKSRNPLLYCYPRHLLSPKSYFDSVVNEGYDFPHPVDFDLVKNHFYAWSTGLAILPVPMTSRRNNVRLPGSMIATSCNNFGDVFWQEWEQKPMPSHKKVELTDYKLKTFVTDWHKEMRKPEYEMQPRPSKNPMEPADCTIILEPLAKEIENLTKIRDSPFNCFQPDQIRHHINRETMIPMNKLHEKLRKYKNSHVKGILDVWYASEREIPETIELEPEEIQVKVEPQDWNAPSSPTNTINIEDSEEEQAEDQQNLAQIEFEIQNTLNLEHEENLESIMSTNNQVPEGWSTEGYLDMLESSQPWNPIDETEDLHNTPHSSASIKRAQIQKKPKKSGFL